MPRTTAASPSRHAIDLVALNDSMWRVCDCVCDDDHDTRKILGYLQYVDGEFEMMWMRRPRPGAIRRYPTMESATEGISRRLGTLP
ncbi:hypothetical protein ACGGZK_07675 [Agromyces sp. MMS24-K17]|uniref:hypothetical protein n=1 Tax=Agromyces sp. MMS24-K17 TaxID=3372850 RepID=UPI003754CEDB